MLDEATASVDTATEKEIQLALDHLLAGRTSIVVAHRLSTVRKADRIAVVEAGRIIEIGKHDVLIKKGGLLRQALVDPVGTRRASHHRRSLYRLLRAPGAVPGVVPGAAPGTNSASFQFAFLL